MTAPVLHSRTMRLRLSSELHSRLWATAARTGMKPTEILRIALLDYCQRQAREQQQAKDAGQ